MMTAHAVALCVALMGAIGAYSASRYAQRGAAPALNRVDQAAAACVAVLDGARFPLLLPEFVVWEHLWTEAAAETFDGARFARTAGLDPTETETVRKIARAARTRVNALRAAPLASDRPGGLALDKDVAVADAILAGRDELIRSLSAPAYERLRTWLSTERQGLTYTFTAAGTVASTAEGPRCRVSIKGTEYPHLIPDAYVWEFYFRVRAAAASSERTSPESYSDEHVAIVRRYDLPIEVEDVLHIIRVATATTAKVDAVRTGARTGGSGPHDLVHLEIARLVAEARDELVRTLPRRAWLSVNADVYRKVSGTIYDFPAEMLP